MAKCVCVCVFECKVLRRLLTTKLEKGRLPPRVLRLALTASGEFDVELALCPIVTC